MKKHFEIAVYTLLIVIMLILLIKPCNKESITYKEVIVSEGDTIWDIAKECNYQDIRDAVDDIRRINNVTPIIQPGQTLIIPIKE